MQEPSIVAIIPAGGIGKRMKTQKPKQFLELNDEPLIVKTISALATCKKIKRFIVPTVDIIFTRKILKPYSKDLDITIISNGKTRQESIHKGLDAIKEAHEKGEHELPEMILVHDAVRALITIDTIEKVISAAVKHGAAIAAAAVTDTLKLAYTDPEDQQEYIKKNVSREHMWVAQTPQVFKTEIIMQAFEKAKEDHFEGTDSAGLVERIASDLGIKINLVESPQSNIKITTQDDLSLAESLLDAI